MRQYTGGKEAMNELCILEGAFSAFHAKLGSRGPGLGEHVGRPAQAQELTPHALHVVSSGPSETGGLLSAEEEG